MITGVAVIGWAIAGAASAGGGWLFHHFVHTKEKVAFDALEARVARLEP